MDDKEKLIRTKKIGEMAGNNIRKAIETLIRKRPETLRKLKKLKEY